MEGGRDGVIGKVQPLKTFFLASLMYNLEYVNLISLFIDLNQIYITVVNIFRIISFPIIGEIIGH